jgi:hypothetical protein
MQGLYGKGSQALTETRQQALEAEIVSDKPVEAELVPTPSESESDKDFRLKHQGYTKAEWNALEAAQAAAISNAMAPKPEPRGQATGNIIGPPARHIPRVRAREGGKGFPAKDTETPRPFR